MTDIIELQQSKFPGTYWATWAGLLGWMDTVRFCERPVGVRITYVYICSDLLYWSVHTEGHEDGIKIWRDSTWIGTQEQFDFMKGRWTGIMVLMRWQASNHSLG